MNALVTRIPRTLATHHVRPLSFLRVITTSALRPQISSFHCGGVLARKRDAFSFSSKAPPDNVTEEAKSEEQPKKAKRKTRSATAKNSLRRVAVEAQRSRDDKAPKKISAAANQTVPKVGLPYLSAEGRLIQGNRR